MKLTIDLTDPEIQRQLQLAINARVDAMVASRIQEAIDKVIATKIERLTEQRIESLATKAIDGKLSRYFSAAYGGGTSDVHRLIAEKVEALLAKHLSR